MPIARLFFFKFAKPVKTPYSPGQTRQISQQIASEISSSVATPDELLTRSPEELIEVVRVLPMAGNQIVELVRREGDIRAAETRRTRLWLAVLAAYVFVSPIISDIIEASPKLKANLELFGETLAAHLLSLVIVTIIPIGAWLTRVLGLRRNSHE